MNLSTAFDSRTVRIKDSRFGDDVLSHVLRGYTSTERIDYNRAMSKATTVSAGGEKGVSIEVKGDTLEPAAALYDALISEVGGYTVTKDKKEINVMETPNWKKLIPIEHKSAVVNEMMPSVQVIKN